MQVFIEVTGQHGQTIIPGGPFANRQAADAALHTYAISTYGSYLAMIQAIDAYGFIIPASGPQGQASVVRTPTKP